MEMTRISAVRMTCKFLIMASLLWFSPTVTAFSAEVHSKKENVSFTKMPAGRRDLMHLQNQVICMFRAVLGMETPDPPGIVYQTRQDDAFSVTWECWDDFDFGEKEFVRRMAAAGVTTQQAFTVLYLSHRNRTQIGIIEIEALKAQSDMDVRLPTIPQGEIQRRITHVQQLIRSFHAAPDIVPQAKRIASCAVSDLQHSVASQKQGDAWKALRWARNAETTILSAKALQALSEKKKVRPEKKSGIPKRKGARQ